MRRVLCFLAVLGGLGAQPALAKDQPNPFSSGEVSMAYAVDPGCVTWLKAGGDPGNYLGRASRHVSEDGKPAQKVYGLGHVTVRIDDHGGCYVRARYGDPAQLRAAVVNSLAESGLKLERLPAGSATTGRDWGFQQETHCFLMDDKVYLVEIYIGTARRTLPLQATFFRDNEGLAARHGLCQAG